MASSKRFPNEVTTRMTPDLHKELKRAAAAEGLTVADFVRDLVAERLRDERLDEDERIRRRALQLAQEAIRRMQDANFAAIAQSLFPGELEEVAA